MDGLCDEVRSFGGEADKNKGSQTKRERAADTYRGTSPEETQETQSDQHETVPVEPLVSVRGYEFRPDARRMNLERMHCNSRRGSSSRGYST